MRIEFADADGHGVDPVLDLLAQGGDLGQLGAARPAPRTQMRPQHHARPEQRQAQQACQCERKRVGQVQVSGLSPTAGEKNQVHLG